MNILLKTYINKITEQDIYNYALKEGITLLGDETRIIYTYLKNYWQVLLNDDSTFIFEELKEKLREETYNKIIELYQKYKKQFF
jgi:urate oxidase